MTMQETILAALKASHDAHQSGLDALLASKQAQHDAAEAVAVLRGEKAALEAKVVDLEARVAHLESQSEKIVEPETVSPILEWLSRAVAATQAAVMHPAASVAAAPVQEAIQTPSEPASNVHATASEPAISQAEPSVPPSEPAVPATAHDAPPVWPVDPQLAEPHTAMPEVLHTLEDVIEDKPGETMHPASTP